MINAAASNRPGSIPQQVQELSIESSDTLRALSSPCRGVCMEDSTAALPSLPSSCTEPSLSITTFNILAPIYKRIGPDENCRESDYHDAWYKRNLDIIRMLLSNDSSIICLQELWLENEELVHLYEDSLNRHGYDVFTLRRTSGRGDGLLTAIKRDRFSVLTCKDLRFNDFGDRVAQILHLRVKVPFFRRNQIAEQQMLLVNTHLLFPHNSSFCLIRLWQVYKIIECLEKFMVEHGLTPVPVILCGDWNGSKRGHVYKFLRSQGFVSCYDSAHRYKDEDAHRWISHRNHRGNVCGVDFIWLRNPGKTHQPLSLSWKEAVLGIIMAKLCEAGESAKEIYRQVLEMGCRLSFYDLQKRLYQLGFTARSAEKMVDGEIKDLLQSFYIEMDDLKKYSVFPPSTSTDNVITHTTNSSNVKMLNCVSLDANSASRYKSVLGLTIQGASLFPPLVEQGMWPEDFALSDHAPLTVILRPRKISD
ncbi:hypothetical protein KP509_24G009100 [Ceratopteris richardii]|uniref:Endonuclease/exonuclease/phosphatase domain-containing protein n=2 Tax=Ceratopteris richardii TaxID=49495 RepID=A0A8T2RT66_CERRI|nr:hypothetical protein KP509_24G009100 [Ceratopteris richardii]